MLTNVAVATTAFGAMLMPFIGNVIFALVVYLVGKWLIDKVVGFLQKSKRFDELDGAVRTFALSFA